MIPELHRIPVSARQDVIDEIFANFVPYSPRMLRRKMKARGISKTMRNRFVQSFETKQKSSHMSALTFIELFVAFQFQFKDISKPRINWTRVAFIACGTIALVGLLTWIQ